MALYQDATIPVPKTATDEAFRKLPPFIANEKNEGRVRWHWRFDTPEKYQEMMKNYYRLATEVDATCGAFSRAEKAGRARQHARHLHRRQRLLPRRARPGRQMVSAPGKHPRAAHRARPAHGRRAKRGGTNDDFTLNVDLAPTILAAAGIAAPRGHAGPRHRAALPGHRKSPRGAASSSTSTPSSAIRNSFPPPRRWCARTGSISTGRTSASSNSSISRPIRWRKTTSPAIRPRPSVSPKCAARFNQLKADAR